MTTRERLWLAIVAAGYAATLCIALSSSMLGAERFALPRELSFELAATALGAMWLTSRPALDRGDRALLACLALGIVSVLVVAINPLLGVRSLGLVAAVAVTYWAVKQRAARPGVGTAVLACVALGVGIAATTAVLEAYGVLEWRALPHRGPGGIVGSRNVLGHLCALSLPAIVYLASRVPVDAAWHKRVLRGVWLACAAVTIVALVLSRSRAAWLAFAASVVVGLVAVAATQSWRHTLRRTAPAFTACVIGIAVLLAAPPSLHWQSATPYRHTLSRLLEHDQGSGRARLIQYQHTAAMVIDHPWLGVGAGNWELAYPAYSNADDPSLHPERIPPVNRIASCDWLSLAGSWGLPALLCLLLAVAGYARASVRALQRAPGGASAALATVAAGCVLATFDTVLMRAPTAFTAALLLGALSPAGAATGARIDPARWWRIARGVAAAGAAAIVLYQSGAQLAAGIAFARDPGHRGSSAASRLAPWTYFYEAELARVARVTGDCGAYRLHAARARSRNPSLVIGDAPCVSAGHSPQAGAHPAGSPQREAGLAPQVHERPDSIMEGLP